ncbi:MAG: thiol-disulfide oxidoreductase DCC family protein [Proteobacteria bacterium]|nr:thiol-disulfide oxidoreductase DCC family protein [Pseudomonadota bacterium]
MATDATPPFADLDAHPVLLFDGVCNLCHGTVRFVLDRDRAARFRFAPLQSEPGRALLTRFALDPNATDTVVLIDAAGAHTRSDAALRVVRALGAPWSWAFALIAIPRPLRDAAYDFIARHRYRWFGKKDACPLPRPEWRARFLA